MRSQVAAGVLVLVWFVALIGGFFGGWINLLLLFALVTFLIGRKRGLPG